MSFSWQDEKTLWGFKRIGVVYLSYQRYLILTYFWLLLSLPLLWIFNDTIGSIHQKTIWLGHRARIEKDLACYTVSSTCLSPGVYSIGRRLVAAPWLAAGAIGQREARQALHKVSRETELSWPCYRCGHSRQQKVQPAMITCIAYHFCLRGVRSAPYFAALAGVYPEQQLTIFGVILKESDRVQSIFGSVLRYLVKLGWALWRSNGAIITGVKWARQLHCGLAMIIAWWWWQLFLASQYATGLSSSPIIIVFKLWVLAKLLVAPARQYGAEAVRTNQNQDSRCA